MLHITAEEEALVLAALQVQAKFGNHRRDVMRPGYLVPQLRGLVPVTHWANKKPTEWEEEIFKKHRKLNEDAQSRPQQLYCAYLEPRDYYGACVDCCDLILLIRCETYAGAVFYPVRQAFSKVLPQILTLAISHMGVMLMNKDTKEVMETYHLTKIYRWGYKVAVVVISDFNCSHRCQSSAAGN
jgi:hypothetical protein